MEELLVDFLLGDVEAALLLSGPAVLAISFLVVGLEDGVATPVPCGDLVGGDVVHVANEQRHVALDLGVKLTVLFIVIGHPEPEGCTAHLPSLRSSVFSSPIFLGRLHTL